MFSENYKPVKVRLWRVYEITENNPQETADLVTFTEEIFNGKLCAV